MTHADMRTVDFEGKGARLRGTVRLPDTRACPGLVLVGGSGPTDRHNGGLFDALGDHLVAAGVAVLAYDKRGAGDSDGTWESATLDDLAGDAAAAVTALQCDPRIDGTAVGILGHSEGGWVALRACTRVLSVRHLILNSCPAVSFADAEIHALRSAGAPGVDAEAAGAFLRRLTILCRKPDGRHEASRFVADAKRSAAYGCLETAGFVFDQASASQLQVWGDYDPLADLVQLKTPTLAVFGSADPLVPVRPSIERYEQTARAAGRTQHTLVFPDADHRLQTVNTTHFAPSYVDCLTAWSRAPDDAGTTPPRHLSGQGLKTASPVPSVPQTCPCTRSTS